MLKSKSPKAADNNLNKEYSEISVDNCANKKIIIINEEIDISLKEIFEKYSIYEKLENVLQINIKTTRQCYVDCHIQFPGINLSISAEEIIIQNDEQQKININLSGKHAPQLTKSTALSGMEIRKSKNNFSKESLGTPGEHGASGNPGQSSGHLCLVGKIINAENLKIILNGGDGAKGQNGGAGECGRNGENGIDASHDTDKASVVHTTQYAFINEPRKYGEQGGVGGNGGVGGLGGEGGYPGKLFINEKQKEPPIKDIDFESTPGKKGDDGLPGKGGNGGKGGKRAWQFGYHSYCVYVVADNIPKFEGDLKVVSVTKETCGVDWITQEIEIKCPKNSEALCDSGNAGVDGTTQMLSKRTIQERALQVTSSETPLDYLALNSKETQANKTVLTTINATTKLKDSYPNLKIASDFKILPPKFLDQYEYKIRIGLNKRILDAQDLFEKAFMSNQITAETFSIIKNVLVHLAYSEKKNFHSDKIVEGFLKIIEKNIKISEENLSLSLGSIAVLKQRNHVILENILIFLDSLSYLNLENDYESYLFLLNKIVDVDLGQQNDIALLLTNNKVLEKSLFKLLMQLLIIDILQRHMPKAIVLGSFANDLEFSNLFYKLENIFFICIERFIKLPFAHSSIEKKINVIYLLIIKLNTYFVESIAAAISDKDIQINIHSSVLDIFTNAILIEWTDIVKRIDEFLNQENDFKSEDILRDMIFLNEILVHFNISSKHKFQMVSQIEILIQKCSNKIHAYDLVGLLYEILDKINHERLLKLDRQELKKSNLDIEESQWHFLKIQTANDFFQAIMLLDNKFKRHEITGDMLPMVFSCIISQMPLLYDMQKIQSVVETIKTLRVNEHHELVSQWKILIAKLVDQYLEVLSEKYNITKLSRKLEAVSSIMHYSFQQLNFEEYFLKIWEVIKSNDITKIGDVCHALICEAIPLARNNHTILWLRLNASLLKPEYLIEITSFLVSEQNNSLTTNQLLESSILALLQESSSFTGTEQEILKRCVAAKVDTKIILTIIEKLNLESYPRNDTVIYDVIAQLSGQLEAFHGYVISGLFLSYGEYQLVLLLKQSKKEDEFNNLINKLKLILPAKWFYELYYQTYNELNKKWLNTLKLSSTELKSLIGVNKLLSQEDKNHLLKLYDNYFNNYHYWESEVDFADITIDEKIEQFFSDIAQIQSTLSILHHILLKQTYSVNFILFINYIIENFETYKISRKDALTLLDEISNLLCSTHTDLETVFNKLKSTFINKWQQMLICEQINEQLLLFIKRSKDSNNITHKNSTFNLDLIYQKLQTCDLSNLRLFLEKIVGENALIDSNSRITLSELENVITYFVKYQPDDAEREELLNISLIDWLWFLNKKEALTDLLLLRVESKALLIIYKKIDDLIYHCDLTKVREFIQAIKKHFSEPKINYLQEIINELLRSPWKLTKTAIYKFHENELEQWKTVLNDEEKELDLNEIIDELILEESLNIQTKPDLKDQITKIYDLYEKDKQIKSLDSKKLKKQLNKWLKKKNENPEKEIRIIALLMRAIQLAGLAGYVVENNTKIYNIPRKTQVASLCLYIYAFKSTNGRLGEIATSEGKTSIIAMFAAFIAFLNKPVNIITSSPLLAISQTKETTRFFKLLGLSASNNCDLAALQNPDIRFIRYLSPIVYGDAESFQRDKLLSEVLEQNILGNRKNEILIVDEVDNKFIDQASNTLYLSHTIHELRYLRRLYIEIWNYINDPNATDEPAFKKTVINHITNRISQNEILIPKFLMQFVMRRLSIWIDSAFQAKSMEENDHFILRTTSNKTYRREQIIPMDNTTGVEQLNMHWSNGLHQFLQLIQASEFSPESLKAIYISNIKYFQEYRNCIYGLSGTLGSESEKKLFKQVYGLDYFKMPRFKNRRFKEDKGVVCATEDRWLSAILNEVKKQTTALRPIIIICENIKKLQMIQDFIQHYLNENQLNLHIIKSAYEEYAIGSKKMPMQNNDIVLATNLAGRGIHYSATKDVNLRRKGIHVIITFLPENARTEEQDFSRTARQGELGSGIQIIHDTSMRDLRVLKKERDRQVACDVEKFRTSTLQSIAIEAKLFKYFTKFYQSVRKQLRKYAGRRGFDETYVSIQLDALNHKWAFWLDEQTELIQNISHENSETLESLYKNFEKVINQKLSKKFEDIKLIESIQHYIRLGTYYYDQCKYTSAMRVFEHAMQREPDFCEVIYYHYGKAIAKEHSGKAITKEHMHPNEASKWPNNLKRALKQERYLIKRRIDELTICTVMLANIMQARQMLGQGQHSNQFCQQIENEIKLYCIHLQAINTVLGSYIDINEFVKYIKTDEHKTEHEYIKKFKQLIYSPENAKPYRVSRHTKIELSNLYFYQRKIKQHLEFPELLKSQKPILLSRLDELIKLNVNKNREITRENFSKCILDAQSFWQVLLKIKLLTNSREQNILTVDTNKLQKIEFHQVELSDAEICKRLIEKHMLFVDSETLCQLFPELNRENMPAFINVLRNNKIMQLIEVAELIYQEEILDNPPDELKPYINYLKKLLSDKLIFPNQSLIISEYDLSCIGVNATENYSVTLDVKKNEIYLLPYNKDFALNMLWGFLIDNDIVKSPKLKFEKQQPKKIENRLDEIENELKLMVKQLENEKKSKQRKSDSKESELQKTEKEFSQENIKKDIQAIRKALRFSIGQLYYYDTLNPNVLPLDKYINPGEAIPELPIFVENSFAEVLLLNAPLELWNWQAFAVAMFGLGQLGLGLTLEILSGGAASPIALILISGGISDMAYAAITGLTGQFTLRNFLIYKTFSLAIGGFAVALTGLTPILALAPLKLLSGAQTIISTPNAVMVVISYGSKRVGLELAKVVGGRVISLSVATVCRILPREIYGNLSQRIENLIFSGTEQQTKQLKITLTQLFNVVDPATANSRIQAILASLFSRFDDQSTAGQINQYFYALASEVPVILMNEVAKANESMLLSFAIGLGIRSVETIFQWHKLVELVSMLYQDLNKKLTEILNDFRQQDVNASQSIDSNPNQSGELVHEALSNIKKRFTEEVLQYFSNQILAPAFTNHLQRSLNIAINSVAQKSFGKFWANQRARMGQVRTTSQTDDGDDVIDEYSLEVPEIPEHHANQHHAHHTVARHHDNHAVPRNQKPHLVVARRTVHPHASANRHHKHLDVKHKSLPHHTRLQNRYFERLRMRLLETLVRVGVEKQVKSLISSYYEKKMGDICNTFAELRNINKKNIEQVRLAQKKIIKYYLILMILQKRIQLKHKNISAEDLLDSSVFLQSIINQAEEILTKCFAERDLTEKMRIITNALSEISAGHADICDLIDDIKTAFINFNQLEEEHTMLAQTEQTLGLVSGEAFREMYLMKKGNPADFLRMEGQLSQGSYMVCATFDFLKGCYLASQETQQLVCTKLTEIIDKTLDDESKLEAYIKNLEDEKRKLINRLEGKMDKIIQDTNTELKDIFKMQMESIDKIHREIADIQKDIDILADSDTDNETKLQRQINSRTAKVEQLSKKLESIERALQQHRDAFQQSSIDSKNLYNSLAEVMKEDIRGLSEFITTVQNSRKEVLLAMTDVMKEIVTQNAGMIRTLISETASVLNKGIGAIRESKTKRAASEEKPADKPQIKGKEKEVDEKQAVIPQLKDKEKEVAEKPAVMPQLKDKEKEVAEKPAVIPQLKDKEKEVAEKPAVMPQLKDKEKEVAEKPAATPPKRVAKFIPRPKAPAFVLFKTNTDFSPDQQYMTELSEDDQFKAGRTDHKGVTKPNAIKPVAFKEGTLFKVKASKADNLDPESWIKARDNDSNEKVAVPAFYLKRN